MRWVVVVDVFEHSPAAGSIQRCDTIVGVDGLPFHADSETPLQILVARATGPMRFKVRRGTAWLDYELTPAKIDDHNFIGLRVAIDPPDCPR